MGKNKKWCNVCEDRHIPPTGKKCTMAKNMQKNVSDVSGQISSTNPDSSSVDSDSSSDHVVRTKKSTVSAKKAPGGGQNSNVSGAMPPGLHSQAGGEQPTEDDSLAGDVQVLILRELRKVSKRLDVVEERMEDQGAAAAGSSRRKNCKLSKNTAHDIGTTVKKNKKVTVVSSSESSDEEFQIPDLKAIRSSRPIQKKIDKKLANLQKSKHDQGNKTPKIKSKRGGVTEVLVTTKVSWPQDHVLGGPSKQRLSYDQLNLTQFVQGFAKNILQESD